MKQLLFDCIVFCSVLLCMCACTGPAEKPYRVWVLHSYQADCPWMDELNRGIVDGFKKEGVQATLVFGHLHSSYTAQRCRDSVKAMLSRMECPDLILAVNDQATLALQSIGYPALQYGETNLRVIFCGVDYPDSIRVNTRFRGFSTRIDVGRSRRLAAMYGLTDIRAFLRYTNLCEIAVDEIKSQGKKANSPVKMGYMDVTRRNYHDAFYAMINERLWGVNVLPEWDCHLAEFIGNAATPYITFSNEGFGSGCLGGYFTPSYNQTLDGARLAARYLKYKHFPDKLLQESEAYFMLDWAVLKRFDLQFRKLPIDDVHYINMPFDVRYKTVLSVGPLIGVALFTLLVVFFLYKANGYKRRKKKMEKTLKFQRDNLQVITNSISEGIISVTSGGRISTINAEARELLHLPLPESEYIDQPLSALVEILDASTLHGLEPLLKVAIGKKETVALSPVSFIKSLVSDRIFLAEGEFTPLKKENISDGAVFVFTDRTDEFTTQEYLALTTAAGQLFFWWYDFDAGRFTIDSSFFTMFGLPDDGTHTLPLTVLLGCFNPEDLARWEDIYARQRFNHDIKTTQEARINVNGKGEQWWEIRMMYRQSSENNSLPTLYGLAVNIQNYKEKQALLQDARDEARRSEQLKSAFLSNMSHEIRTPLNGIIGFAKLIAGDENYTPEEYKLFVETIQSNCNVLLALINDILDLARIDTGNMVYRNAPCNLTDLIRQIATTQQVIIQKPLTLVQQFPAEPVTLTIDKLRLNQVITNLVNNAVKFTEAGSITVGYTTDKQEVRIFVSDTGMGMPEEEQGRIFERFYKKHNDIQGAGIGLSLCKNIVEHYGGRILVASEVGKGSTFTVVLPEK